MALWKFKSGRGTLRPWLPWALTLLVALLALAVSREAVRRHQLVAEQQSLQAELQQLQDRNTDLVKLLEYAKSPTYTEEQARLRFGLAREGERVAIVPAPPPATATRGSGSSGSLKGVATSETPPAPNYLKWWRAFFR